MTELSDIYSNRILELAAAIPHCGRLAAPDATASAHSKLCGSTVTVDLVMRDGHVAAFGQTVKACLLGQASASVMGHNILGSTAAELAAVTAQVREMLKHGGPAPVGRWSDLAALTPVRDYPQRHASTLLVFDAVERALQGIESGPQRGATVQSFSAAGT